MISSWTNSVPTPIASLWLTVPEKPSELDLKKCFSTPQSHLFWPLCPSHITMDYRPQSLYHSWEFPYDPFLNRINKPCAHILLCLPLLLLNFLGSLWKSLFFPLHPFLKADIFTLSLILQITQHLRITSILLAPIHTYKKNVWLGFKYFISPLIIVHLDALVIDYI